MERKKKRTPGKSKKKKRKLPHGSYQVITSVQQLTFVSNCQESRWLFHSRMFSRSGVHLFHGSPNQPRTHWTRNVKKKISMTITYSSPWASILNTSQSPTLISKWLCNTSSKTRGGKKNDVCVLTQASQVSCWPEMRRDNGGSVRKAAALFRPQLKVLTNGREATMWEKKITN